MRTSPARQEPARNLQSTSQMQSECSCSINWQRPSGPGCSPPEHWLCRRLWECFFATLSANTLRHVQAWDFAPLPLPPLTSQQRAWASWTTFQPSTLDTAQQGTLSSRSGHACIRIHFSMVHYNKAQASAHDTYKRCKLALKPSPAGQLANLRLPYTSHAGAQAF